MTATYTDAVDAVAEYVLGVEPATEADALDAAREGLEEFVDSALIYTYDVLKLWDGSTHDEVGLSHHEDIMSAVTASTYFQLMEDWHDAIYDGIDKAIWEYLPEWDSDELDRDDALAYVFGTRD